MAWGRVAFALIALSGMAFGQPTLTTIQDTLFKADGTLFNGTLAIHWVTFDFTNGGVIVQQQTTVSVVNGNLFVQLAPNVGAQSPANIYTVDYQSDGREQFEETWTVPASTVPLRVASVRVSVSGGSGGGNNTGGGGGPVAESDVVNLVADLSQRPVKGVGFGTDRVAVIDDTGAIEAAVGSPGDCVLVDGTTGPCGQPQPSFVDGETPGGIVDGSNTTFTLSNLPVGASLMLFRNGLYMKAGFDYSLNGSSIQFASGGQPQPLDTLAASYRVNALGGTVIGGGSGGGTQAVTAQVLCSAGGASTQATTALAGLGSCNIAGAALMPGDRIEIQFTFSHTGTAAGYRVQVNWGNTTLIDRQAANQDIAVTGRADAAITASGAQLSLESWGTVLTFLPGIVNAPYQNGLTVSLNGLVLNAADTLTLSNYTVLRYPAN